MGLGGAGARVGKGKEFGKASGAGNSRLGEGARQGQGGGTFILTGLPPPPTGGFGKTEQAAKAWLEILQPTLLGTQSWRAGGGQGGGRERNPGEGRAPFGAGGPGARSLGRGLLALSPCSLLPPSPYSPTFPLSPHPSGSSLADCGQT